MHGREEGRHDALVKAVGGLAVPEVSSVATGVLALQRQIGNRAVARWVGGLQSGSALDGRSSPKSLASLAAGTLPMAPRASELSRWPRGLRLPIEPSPSYGAGQSERTFSGRRFIRGAGDRDEIDPSDVRQGGLGDCWLMAALAAIAHARPGYIRSLIDDLGDGTYVVRLPDFGPGDDWLHTMVLDPRTHTMSAPGWSRVRIRAQFPTYRNGAPVYGQVGDTQGALQELWVMLIERALATRAGSYDALDATQTGGGFLHLTGHMGESHQLHGQGSNATLYQALHRALRGGQAIVAATPVLDPALEAGLGTVPAGWLQSSHVYAVINVSPETVTLRNPNYDGNFPVPIQFFRENWTTYTTSPVVALPAATGHAHPRAPARRHAPVPVPRPNASATRPGQPPRHGPVRRPWPGTDAR